MVPIPVWLPVNGYPLPGEFHGQRRQAGHSPWFHKRIRHDWVINTSKYTYIPIFNFGDENWKIRGGGKRDVRKDCFFSWFLLKCPFLQGKSCCFFNHSRKHSPYQRKWRAGLELCALFSLQLSRFVLCLQGALSLSSLIDPSFFVYPLVSFLPNTEWENFCNLVLYVEAALFH